MNNFEKAYLNGVTKWFAIALLAHIPVMMFVAFHFHTNIWMAVGIGGFIASGPLLLRVFLPQAWITISAIGAACMGMSGLLIHLSRGMIEMHFHIFIILATLVVLARPSVILVAAGTIAVHHVLFFYLFPSSVFNYQASLGIVALHALFVVVEAAVLFILAHQFRSFISIPGKLGYSVEAINLQSRQIHKSSLSMADAATQQSAALEETSASMEQIGSLSARNAERFQEALKMASVTHKVASQGASDMQVMSLAMEAIHASSDSISKIVKTINEIAFQTNLLALNAAVEAARAGVAGAGFAVVAEEVRALARRSADAVSETTDRIEDSISKSRHGVETSRKVAQALEGILGKTGGLDTLVSELASATSEQDLGIQQVNKALAQIDQLTQSSAGHAEQSAHNAEALQVEADTLSRLADHLMALAGSSMEKPTPTSRTSPQPASKPEPRPLLRRATVVVR